jgi:hypothetical protein
MIGRIDPNRKVGDSTNYVYVVGSDKLSTDLKPISEGMNKKYSKLELDYKFDDPNDPKGSIIAATISILPAKVYPSSSTSTVSTRLSQADRYAG